MKLSSSGDDCVAIELLLSDASLVKGEYMGVIFEMGERGEEGSVLNWE